MISAEIRLYMLMIVMLSMAVQEIGGELACASAICDNAPCEDDTIQCDPGFTPVPKSSTCGCCASCIQTLAEGDECFAGPYATTASDMFYTWYEYPSVCGDGLYCDRDASTPTCIQGVRCEADWCSRVRCAQAVCAWNQTHVPNGGECGCCDTCVTPLDEGSNCFSEPYPFPAAEDGSYIGLSKTRVCKDGLYCDEHRMAAVCRIDDCANRRDSVISQDIIPGQYVPQCNVDGGYNAKQCGPGSVCYCVDENNVQLEHTVVHISEGQDLTCYDCVHRRDAALAKQLFGQYIPQCNPDGTYTAKQCGPGPVCHCVDDQNNKVGQYSAPSWEAQFMTCLCAREKDKLQDDMMQCTELGNFNHIVFPPNRAYSHESMTSLLIVMACLCLLFVKE